MPPSTNNEIKAEKERIIKDIPVFLSGFLFHAGMWHDETCYFPHADRAVCHCDLPKNKKMVQMYITDALNSLLLTVDRVNQGMKKPEHKNELGVRVSDRGVRSYNDHANALSEQIKQAI